MISLFAALVLASSPPAAAPQAVSAPKLGEAYVMPRTAVRTIKAKSGGEYRIFVSWPEAPPPPGGYPILYLLDGNESFPVATTVAHGLGRYLAMEPGVIVGIGYPSETRRSFDYTPAVPPDRPTILPLGPSGGAEALLAFIADELQPSIEAELPVDPKRRTLSGYSLGGLFTLYTLFNRPDLFQTYVAGSPSIWFGQNEVLKLESGLAAKLRAARGGRRLFLSAGQYEQDPLPPPGGETEESRKFADISAKARMVDNARELAGRLDGLKEEGLTVHFQLAPGESHATGTYPAMRDALLGAFGPRQ
ncbi:alpha/beta hydrolase [Sphingosinicella rhizophila]|uniref:Alpha/beta hydrolase-fold protein n=1 Tax=Sphingosinicella rhizophila TaxID=3050082 RepID=A0ABU3Q3Z5_9SPHN|nr:alpha/beta hydrolase-fold protein [Sphingosinicella sp. GR2756]MDT9598147.1 alpha/beta hydrolase-fold protein [Sphingosinicella sp. GR2756]